MYRLLRLDCAHRGRVSLMSRVLRRRRASRAVPPALDPAVPKRRASQRGSCDLADPYGVALGRACRGARGQPVRVASLRRAARVPLRARHANTTPLPEKNHHEYEQRHEVQAKNAGRPPSRHPKNYIIHLQTTTTVPKNHMGKSRLRYTLGYDKTKYEIYSLHFFVDQLLGPIRTNTFSGPTLFRDQHFFLFFTPLRHVRRSRRIHRRVHSARTARLQKRSERPYDHLGARAGAVDGRRER